MRRVCPLLNVALEAMSQRLTFLAASAAFSSVQRLDTKVDALCPRLSNYDVSRAIDDGIM